MREKLRNALERTACAHLCLAVRANPRQRAVLADLRQAVTDARGEVVRHGHGILRLVGGVAEHDTLVTGADVLHSLANVHTLSNVWALLLNRNDDVDGLVVQALLNVVVADVLDRVTDDLLVVHHGLGRDLTEDHDHARLRGRLCSASAQGESEK